MPAAAGALLLRQKKRSRDILNIQHLEITQVVQSLMLSACPLKKCKYGLSSTNDYHHTNRIPILSINTVSTAPHLFHGPNFFGHFWNHRTMALLVGRVGESIRRGNKKDVQAYNRLGGRFNFTVTVYQGGYYPWWEAVDPCRSSRSSRSSSSSSSRRRRRCRRRRRR